MGDLNLNNNFNGNDLVYVKETNLMYLYVHSNTATYAEAKRVWNFPSFLLV